MFDTSIYEFPESSGWGWDDFVKYDDLLSAQDPFNDPVIEQDSFNVICLLKILKK
jgi:hypothetical protein